MQAGQATAIVTIYYANVVYITPMSDQQELRDPTTQAREAIEIVCKGDLARLEEFYSPDFVDHVNDLIFYGRDGARQSVGIYRAVFDDLQLSVEEQVTEDNRVASRWLLRGSNRGRRVELRGIVISRIDEDGRIVEDWGYSDTLALLRQLGVLRSVLLGLKWLTGRIRVPKGETGPAH